MKMMFVIAAAILAFAASGTSASARGCPIQNNGWCIFIEPGP